MGYLHLTQHSEASPEALFGYAVRTDRLPTWLTLLVGLSAADDRLDTVGAAFTGDLRLGGTHLVTTWTVVEVAPPRKLRFSGSADDGSSADLWFRFARWNEGAEVRFELDYELSGGFLSTVVDRLFVERAIARDLKHSLGTFIGIVEEHPEML